MKKVLFFLAAISVMFMANAQVKLIVNGEGYEAGSTIEYSVAEEDIYELDYMAIVNMNVQNTTAEDMNGVTVEAVVVDAPGYSVMSICAGVCQDGTVSRPFNIPANGVFENVTADLHIAPSELAADKKGEFKIKVNTATGSPLEFNLVVTYVPSAAGIADVEMGRFNIVQYQQPIGLQFR